MSDYRWLTESSKLFLERDYLVEGQTVDDRVDVICNNAERILNKPGFAKAFKENIQKGWYSLASPIWTNFGNDRGLPISCFGSYIADSTDSILHTHAEVGMMTKNGGGTSAYFGNVRERGALIRGGKNGVSSGSVHFMQMYESAIQVISQGSSRRGQFAAYLPLDHKDIMEFLGIRSEGHPIQDLSFGITVTDQWMQDMIDGDYSKRVIWARVLECRANTGYPYIVFIDTVNRDTVDVYKEKGMKITHSNLCCVAGNQRVVSDRGLKTAKQLYEEGKELVLFDGKDKVNASAMQLISENAETFKITLKNGMSHTITANHKIQTNKGMIRADQLNINDRVAIQTKKGIFGKLNMEDEAFLLGLYQGDGTGHKDIIMLDIWENDFDLIVEIEQKFNKVFYKYGCDKYNVSNQYGNSNYTRTITPPKFLNCKVAQSTVKKKRLASNCLKKCLGFEKGYVPSWIWEANEKTQWQYIKGLYYTDGTVHVSKNNNGEPLHLSLCNISKVFLQEIQLLLANLGIKSSICLLRKACKCRLPDGKGDFKLYDTKDCYRLVTGSKNDAIEFEENTGFISRKKITLENREYRDNSKKFFKVIKIEYLGNQPVYCCEVDTTEHKWVCNGIITHNSEIMLPDSENESFVCDLSSMNILYYDEWKNTNAVELLTYFLDAVMTEFIDKAKKIPFMERPVRFAENHRALGIGWIGWHSYLQSKMIAFESMEAKLLNSAVAKNIKVASYAASAKLAVEYGEPPLLKGYGRRNSTLMAIAPTKSSAFILGQASECTEPNRTNYYIKDLQKGKFTIKNFYLEKLLREKGFDNNEIWDSILKHGGSVQHLECLTQEEKDVFKTFAEISQKEIIIQTAQRQKFVDQSQSTNLMIHPSVKIKDVNALMIEAWKLGVKSLYYQISVNAAQAFSRDVLTCRSCEG
jgi:ribonucleoside-diphosphate reductase alpha chain